jgi:hypothetical protein
MEIHTTFSIQSILSKQGDFGTVIGDFSKRRDPSPERGRARDTNPLPHNDFLQKRGQKAKGRRTHKGVISETLNGGTERTPLRGRNCSNAFSAA